MKIYYAHHLWKYGTEIEKYELDVIKSRFPDVVIINPATDVSQFGTSEEIMAKCFKDVKSCDSIVFSSVDGIIGKGVFDEVALGASLSKPIFYIFNNQLLEFRGSLETILKGTSKRIFATVKM